MIIKCSRRRGVAITTTLPLLWCYKFHFMQICLLWQFFRCFKWFVVIFSLWLFGKYCSTYCSWANWSQLPQENIMWKIYLRKTDTNRHRRCSIKKGVLKNFAIFTEKYLCWSLFNKVAGLFWGTSANRGFWTENQWTQLKKTKTWIKISMFTKVV